MPINTNTDYIEIGTGVNTVDNSLINPLILPAPHGLGFADNFLVDAGRNANATMIIQQIGRTQFKSNISWSRMTNRKFWELNRWFQKYGYVFYLKYFSHTDGKVKIHRFYRGNMNDAKPSTEQEVIDNISVPRYYKDVGFSVIDMGEDNVIVVQTIGGV